MRTQLFVPLWSSGRRVARGLALAALLVGLSALGVQAQTGRVTGRVTDGTSGAPLAQVQVYLPGTGLGTLSRQDGRFLILNVPAGSYTVTAERVGQKTATQAITVGADQTVEVDLTMETQALGLDEIVVTGTAGAARRREVGNSVTSLDIAQVPEQTPDVTDLLQGSAPGIELTGGGGQLGQGKQIRLRGNSSVSMTNQPIIYVDGVRMMDGVFPRVDTPGMTQGRGARITVSPLDQINPNDIERIEVIKGSAATTLYGTEASAGVIQIFTKRGSQGAPVWTAETSQGTGWAVKYGVNGVNYMHMEPFLRSPWWGSGYDPGANTIANCPTNTSPDYQGTAFDESTENARWKGVNSSPGGKCTYPGKQWYQTYNMSVRGGGQALQYFISGGFQDDTGMEPLDKQKRYNFQGNFTMSPISDLQIQWTTSYANTWLQSTPSGNNLSGIELQVMRQERNYMGGPDPRTIAQALDYDFQTWVERFTSGLTLNYNPVADLTNRFTLGYDYSQQEGRNLMPIGFWELPQGSLTDNVFQKRTLTFDYVGTYSFGLPAGLRSNFSWGGQAIGSDERQVIGSGQNFPGAVEPTLSSAAVRISEENRQKVWNAGFFLQNVFDIADRYFITAGLRVDGNSAFGSGFGLQTYPKVSGSWVVSDEGFWPESMGSLKLRAAYGQSGRAPGAFDAVRTWDPQGFIGRPAFLPKNQGNPDLGPEVTSELEAGFDGSWLGDRLTATFSWYHQVTKDALMNVSPIPSLGFNASSNNGQLENVGKLQNNGLELQVNGSLIDQAVWGLDLGLGISTSHTKVLSLGGNQPFNALSGRIIEGESVPAAYGYRVANPNEIADPVLENNGQQVVIGSIFPTTFFTPSITVRTPGNVTLSARGEYRGGNWVEVNPIPIGRSVRSPICYPYYQDPLNDIKLKDGIPAIWKNRCTPGAHNDYWFKGDYFKLRAVTATVPVNFAFPDRVSNATLTVTLANAWSWYKEIPWYDVEMTSDSGAGQAGEGFANAAERTPAPATLRFALRVTF